MDPRPVPPAAPLRHIPQLDGLRTIAVALVCWHHWMPRRFHGGVNWGATGVDLFFVLSGFLITGILLDGRRHHESGHQSAWFTARRFYARRLLRIFPLYYAVLVPVSLAFTLDGGTLASLWTYTFNLYGGHSGLLSGRPFSHFWSLAVEEQFYLVWPWVILLAPRRALGALIVATIAVGPISRAVLQSAGAPFDVMRMVTTSCLDLLAGGALLAWLAREDGAGAVLRRPVARALAAVGFPLLAWGLWIQATRVDGSPASGLEVLVVYSRWPAFAWIVLWTATGPGGAIGRFLASRPMTWIGQISYGVYVFHAFALLLDRVGLRALHPLARFPIYAAFTLVVSALSWRLFESRVNALKSRFPYRRREPATETRQAA